MTLRALPELPHGYDEAVSFSARIYGNIHLSIRTIRDAPLYFSPIGDLPFWNSPFLKSSVAMVLLRSNTSAAFQTPSGEPLFNFPRQFEKPSKSPFPFSTICIPFAFHKSK